jgi:hypothetical protein
MTHNQEEDPMRSEGTPQSLGSIPAPDSTLVAPADAALDGDFEIEGDGGTVDNGSQAQVPPPG